jgi:hypothetical protein
LASGATALTLATAAMALWVGCAEPSGRYVDLDLRVERAEPAATIQAREGWTVELSEAHLVVGPLYLFGPIRDPGVLARLWRWAGPAEAVAHVASNPRPVVAELLLQYAVDLLAPAPLDVEGLTAIQSECETAEMVLFGAGAIATGSPAGEIEAMAGGTALVAGTARRGDESVAFRGSVTVGDEGAATVRNVEAEGALEMGSTMVLRVDLGVWFAGVDFSGLTPEQPGEVVELTAAHQAWGALQHGVRSQFAYRVEIEP